MYLSMATSFHKCSFGLIDWTVFLPHVDHTLCIRQSETEQVQRSSQGMHRVWFFSAVGSSNKSSDVETDEQREDRLQLAHDRGNDNMVLRLINTAQ